MRKLALALLATTAIATAAHAADMGIPARTVAVAAPASGVYFGVGANAAVLQEKVDWLTAPGIGTGNLHPAGFGGDLVIGYRIWSGAGAFVALEADAAYNLTRGGAACMNPAGVQDWCSTNNSWSLHQTLKIGMPIAAMTGLQPFKALPSPTQWPFPIPLPSSLGAASIAPYVAGGAVERNVSACIVSQGCTTAWLVGWAVGGGILVPISAGWNLDLAVMRESFNQSFQPGGMPVPVLFPAGTWKLINGTRTTLSLTSSF